ncbi:MAG: sulfite exporter TauE/SafE family protein [Acidobacteriota bacterium]
MTNPLWIAAAGAAGSFHCLGMCSAFALALAPSRGARWKTVGRHLAYNSGRVTSYCFLGLAAGTIGQAAAAGGPIGLLQRALAIVSGILMTVMALQFFGYRVPLSLSSAPGLGSLLRGVRGLLRAPGIPPPLAFGVFNGFLPCPLVYAFVAQALATGSAARGLLTMIAFGLGTFPAMLLVGLVGWGVTPGWRVWGLRLAGTVILIFGLITIARGAIAISSADGHAGHLMAMP